VTLQPLLKSTSTYVLNVVKVYIKRRC